MSLSKTAGTHAPHGTDRAIAPHRPVGRWFMHSVVTAGTVTYLGSTFVLDTDVRTTATIVVAAMLLAIAIVYWQRIRGPALAAVIVALTVSSVYRFAYDTPSLHLGWIDLFPLVMWTGGLLIISEIYRRLTSSYRLAAGLLIYLAGLLAVEYLGYYWLGIRETPVHPSLLGLGIIHGPPIIHAFYIAAGPAYIVIINRMRLGSDDAAG